MTGERRRVYCDALVNAHNKLDRGVAAAYGWPEDISTDDALAKLLELNLRRTC